MQNTSTNQEADAAKKAQKFSLIFLAAVLILSFIPGVSFFSGSNSAMISFEEDGISFQYPDDSSEYVAYDAITGIELLDKFSYGSCISGGTEKSCSYGLWENDELGEYHLCCNDKLTMAIKITTDSGIYVMNYESDDVTQQIYSNLLQPLSGEDEN